MLTLVGAFLVVAAYYASGLWWAIFISFIPFIHAVRTSNTKKALLLGGMFGTIVLGSLTSATLWASLPEYGGEFSSTASFVLVVLSWLLFFAPLVPTVVAWAAILHSYKRIDGSALAVLALAWVILEWARMYVFNLATHAPGINNPPFFSATAIGYVLADNGSWLQLASFGGIYLLSGAVLLVNLLLWSLMKSRKSWLLVAAIGVLVLISVAPLASLREAFDDAPRHTVSIGFMSLHQAGGPDSGAEAHEIVIEPFIGTLDLVLLPENTGTNAVPYAVIESMTDERTILVKTGKESAGGILSNIARAETPDSVSSPVRVKSMLATQGEYIAGIFLVAAKLAGVSPELKIANLTSGTWGSGLTIGRNGVRVSVLFCVEMLAPGFGKERAAKDASQLLLLAMSHSQFRGAPTLVRDTLRYIKVRAVEAGMPLVASGKSTSGYAIDSYGRVMSSIGASGASQFGVVQLGVLSTGGL